MCSQQKLRVLELFSGIGGLHWALKVADIPCEIVAAMELNTTVMEIYSYNFKDANVVNKNLSGITAKEINDLRIDAIVMSPPCQPFCRMGNRLDTDDNRTGPLSQITAILADVNFKYIFVENVQGFEDSTARDNLLEVLTKLNFKWQEFMLTPRTLGIPNSRLRYYLIGKHQDMSSWPFTLQQGSLLSEIPNWNVHQPDNQSMPFENLKHKIEMEAISRRERWNERCSSTFLQKNSTKMNQLPYCVGDIIEWDIPDDLLSRLKVSNSTLQKYYQAMDIVTPFSINTCCFTKGYGKFVKGTGSILKISCDDDDDQEDCDSLSNSTLNSEDRKQKEILSLRYFSPKEISRLMSYPEEFQLPPKLSLGQKYRSLGNSVNVHVVAVLFTLLFSN